MSGQEARTFYALMVALLVGFVVGAVSSPIHVVSWAGAAIGLGTGWFAGAAASWTAAWLTRKAKR